MDYEAIFWVVAPCVALAIVMFACYRKLRKEDERRAHWYEHADDFNKEKWYE